MNKKVMVAMSGGVDSSVTALLLQQQGYDICGVTLKLYSNDDIDVVQGKTCCSLDDVEDARSVAYKMGFDHYVVNFKEQFKEEVMERFVNAYLHGQTPNPCIDCNRYIKFEELFKRAVALGQDYVATGHYVRIEKDKNRYLLKKAVDLTKDQSYVLYSMSQDQLSKTLFPLGGLCKSEVRKIAEKMDLRNSKKPDSQDICFVPDGDYASFIEKYTGKVMPKGNFIDKDGNVLGEHMGLLHYTIGQRKGLGIALGRPMFVSGIDAVNNTVTLADNQDLFSNRLIATDINLIAVDSIISPMKVKAKVRYRQIEEPATIFPTDNNNFLVEFDNPQRAITPGQAVVFYDGDIVIGGGTIVGKK